MVVKYAGRLSILETVQLDDMCIECHTWARLSCTYVVTHPEKPMSICTHAWCAGCKARKQR